MGNSNPSAGEREADRELRLHLMGRLSAEMLAGLLPRLVASPAEKTARDILSWAREQTGPATFREYLSAGFRRLLALSAHAAVDPTQTSVLREVDGLLPLRLRRPGAVRDVAQLLEGCPLPPRPPPPPCPPRVPGD
jgi:hypothetical protein